MMKKLIFTIVLIILVELIASVLYPRQVRLEKILNILEQDPILFWKHKSKLNLIFEGARIRSNSYGLRAEKEYASRNKNGAMRIICLGASPTFGWGVNFEDSYPQQLEKILKARYPDKKFEVINAGIIGYSSYQGLLLLKSKILDYSPDIITVAYVINDVDRYRFFRSSGSPDKELAPLDPMTIFLKNTFRKSRIYELLEKSMATVGSIHNFPQVRVSEDDYRNNLEEIINISRRNNIKLVFIKMPVNLPLPHYIDENSKKKAQDYVSLARNSMRQGHFKEAVLELQDAASVDPYPPEAYFYQGVCYRMLKNHGRSEELFAKAKDFMAFRCRLDSEKYNTLMQEIADAHLVPLADIALKFKEYSAEQLFVDLKSDPIHPNKFGHKIIAEEVLAAIERENIFFTASIN